MKLQITTEFITDEQLLQFLNQNDLNIFLYPIYNEYYGLSSSIDFALACHKPIAICKSNMFSHLFNVSPSICIEDNPLPIILKNGIEPLKKLYNDWSQKNFVEKIDKIIETLKRNKN